MVKRRANTNNNNNNNKNRNSNARRSKKNNSATTKTVYVQQPMSIGAQLGHGLQKFAESAFAKIFGKGDYEISENITSISKNSLMGASMKPPSFADAGKGTFIFEHSEYCGDVVSSNTIGAFDVKTYLINPSDPDLFPWLSSIATSFEYYSIEGLLFRYVSTSGESVASTNTTLGQVMMYVNPDVYDGPPSSKQVMLQYEGCVDAKPSKNILVGAECDPKRLVSDKFYVGAAPSGADRRFSDFGKLVVATNGFPGSAVVCGELWAHYRIRFYTTKTPESGLGPDNASARYCGSLITNTNLFGSVTWFSRATLTNFSHSAANEFTWDAQSGDCYLINVVWQADSNFSMDTPSHYLKNCTAIDYLKNNSNVDAPMFDGSTLRKGVVFLVRAPAEANIGFGFNTVSSTAATYVDVTVTRMSSTLL